MLITNGVNSAFSQAYEYDSLSRLTRASRSLQEERFTYDANGNRLRHAIVNAQTSGIGPQPYPIAPTAAPTRAITSQEFVLEYESGSNRLLRRSGPDGSTNYRYNQQGHRIATQSDGAASYTGAFDQNYQYDTFNRLIGVGIQGAMDATYLYNALDQRVATGHFSSLNATFVYADQNRLLGELGASGEWKDYLWFGDELVGVVDGGWRLSYVHPDHLGRPEVATDGNRQPVWRAGNHAFGREILQDAIGGLKLGFPGQYWDEGGGFWHNGMRDYDDEVGRYLQTDPAGLVAGTNTYAYASGNPITSLDPAGLDDFNLIPRKEPMHSWVNNYRDGPRILSIAVHAMPGRFFVNGRLISGRALFDLLSKDPKFVEQLAQADAVQLNSCRSGKTDEEGYNAAQDFADAAGKPTYAPQQWNWRRPDGSFFIGGAIGGESKNGWDHGYDGNLIFWPSGAQ